MGTRKKQGYSFSMFLVGLGAGSAFGVLVAPANGRKARTELRKVFTRLTHLGRRKSSIAARRAETAATAIREQIGAAIGRISDQARTVSNSASGRKRPAGDGDLLNRATRDQLLEVYGIGPVLADRIIENRPYRDAQEVVERGILPQRIFEQLRRNLLKAQRSA